MIFKDFKYKVGDYVEYAGCNYPVYARVLRDFGDEVLHQYELADSSGDYFTVDEEHLSPMKPQHIVEIGDVIRQPGLRTEYVVIKMTRGATVLLSKQHEADGDQYVFNVSFKIKLAQPLPSGWEFVGRAVGLPEIM